jgi:riboflavin synthase
VGTGKLGLGGVNLGDSIAVNGVCLTAIALNGAEFAADVSRETLALTTLGGLKPGSQVNLEKALTLATPLGGHLVSGHVDGMGEILERQDDGRSWRLRSRPRGRRCAQGSICGRYQPHGQCRQRSGLTQHSPHPGGTIIGGYAAGTRVNLVDLIARYLERLRWARRPQPQGKPAASTRHSWPAEGSSRWFRITD